MSEIELKPCPFCGGEACLKDGKPIIYGRFEVLVICKKCSASVVGVATINFKTEHKSCNGYNLAKEQVIKSWNRRFDNGKL